MKTLLRLDNDIFLHAVVTSISTCDHILDKLHAPPPAGHTRTSRRGCVCGGLIGVKRMGRG